MLPKLNGDSLGDRPVNEWDSNAPRMFNPLGDFKGKEKESLYVDERDVVKDNAVISTREKGLVGMYFNTLSVFHLTCN